MKKILLTLFFGMMATLMGCTEPSKNTDKIVFATSATYPPFEYKQYDEIKGFDIDLANKIAEQLGKKAEFKDMQFSAILPALQAGQADAAIATLTITEERKKNFDFSDPYYFEAMGIVFSKKTPTPTVKDLAHKKIAHQLGAVMEGWLKQNAPLATRLAMDDTNQAIEALKAGHVDYVLLDGAQAAIFSEKNEGLTYHIIGQALDGFGIVVKKGSPLLNDINEALKTLQKNGDIEQLKTKWLKPKRA